MLEWGDAVAKRVHPIPWGRYFWGLVLRFLMWLFVKVEIRGMAQLPRDGAGIIYYNHIHWLDPVLISGKLARYNVPLTKIEAASWPLVGFLLKGYHVIFITRGVVDRQALGATWDVLADGDISVISPEGTRSLDGMLKAAKEGLAFVGRRAPDAWWMPCAVTGTPKFKFSVPLLKRTPVALTFGRPFRVKWPGDQPEKTSREEMREITDEAMAQLAALLPADMRGDYAAADPAQRRWIEFME
jgi:1-acyl-sn-glycerol-3-phosphate acyltransferase